MRWLATLLLAVGLASPAAAQVLAGPNFAIYQAPRATLSLERRNPGRTDDTAHGFAVNSYWRNGSNGWVWQASDVTANAAVWTLVSASPQVLPIDAVGGTAPEAAYGTSRLRAAYAGNAVQLIRASDSTTQDIGFVGDQADLGAISSFCANTTCKVTIEYDQSGHGRDALQPDDVYRPIIYPGVNTIGGVQSITVDQTQFLLVPSSAAVNGNTSSVFLLARPAGFYNQNNAFFTYNTSTSVAVSAITKSGTTASVTSVGHGLSTSNQIFDQGATDMLYNGAHTVTVDDADHFHFTMAGTPSANAATTTSLQFSKWSFEIGHHPYKGYTLTDNTYAGYDSSLRIVDSPSIMGLVFTSSGAQGTLWQNEESHASGRNPAIANPTAGGFIGPAGDFTTANKAGHVDINSVIVWGRALSSTERSNMRLAFYQMARLVPQVDAQVVYVGDSITAGNTLLGARPYALLASDRYSRPALTWLMAQNGLTMATISAASGLLAPSTMYRSAYKSNVMVLFAGTNDIAGGTSGATTYGYITTYVGLAHTAGFKVIVGTMLARSGLTAGQLTERSALNAAILANAAGAEAVADFGGDTILGDQASTGNAAYFGDGIHPTALMQPRMASILIPVLAAVLGPPN
jgi:lysophospholipase L1-like esterase